MRSEKQRRILVELLKGPRTRDQLMTRIGAVVSSHVMRQLLAAGLVHRGQTDQQLDAIGDDGRLIQWSLSRPGREKAEQLAAAEAR